MDAGVSKLRVGRLLPGWVEIGDGANRPVRGIAATHEGEVPVIAKKIAGREIAVEIICAVLGRAAGLPVPEPLALIDENGVWSYGSADVGHPNLAQFVSTNNSAVLDELEKWPALLPAACFDELIVNPDRNDGNLLYDGQGFFLIDHGLCIPHGMQAADRSDDYHTNQLLELHIGACRDEVSKQRTVSKSREWSEQRGLSSVSAADQITADTLSADSQQKLISFLKERAALLGSILHERIKPTQQRRLELD